MKVLLLPWVAVVKHIKVSVHDTLQLFYEMNGILVVKSVQRVATVHFIIGMKNMAPVVAECTDLYLHQNKKKKRVRLQVENYTIDLLVDHQL